MALRFLSVKCLYYQETQRIVKKAQYEGSFLFVNWHRNQVLLLVKSAKIPIIQNKFLDQAENAINKAKTLSFNLTEAQ